jgi:hypothetical protein
VRSAASTDGAAIWVSGDGNSQSGGVWHLSFGATSGTQVLAEPDNLRFCRVYDDGGLYGTSGSGTYANVFAIGALPASAPSRANEALANAPLPALGVPAATLASALSLPGMPISTASPYAFALLDRDARVPGRDLLYVADSRSPQNGGGVQAWQYDGSVWSQREDFTKNQASGVRGLAATVLRSVGSTGVVAQGKAPAAGEEAHNALSAEIVLLVATTTANKLITLVDDGLAPSPQVLRTASTNTAYRGVAFLPRASEPALAPQDPGQMSHTLGR